MNTTAVATIRPEVLRIFNLQQKTAPELGRNAVKTRLAKLKKLRIALNAPEWLEALTDAMQKDFRKPPIEAYASEVGTVSSYIAHIDQYLSGWLAPQGVPTPLPLLGIRSYTQLEPKGQVLIIAPWNYPVLLAFCPLVYAIAAGNTVVLKPSELTPHTAAFIKRFLSSLFDESEVAVVEGDVEAATALLELPFHHIHFTGSPAVGKIVMAAAAKNLTSVTLELGGKSPAIVDPSANVALAAQKMAWAKQFNNGQTCVAPDYAIVHESVLSPFLHHYQAALNQYFNETGAGIQASKSLPRIINLRHFNRVKALVEDAIGKGAEAVISGTYDEKDLFLAPTVLTGVNETMNILQEEIFGPVLPVLTYRNPEELPEIINRRPKPLTLYMASKNTKNIRYVMSHTSAGSTIINDYLMGFSNPHLPMGGVNNSGIGRSLGLAGFKEFCNERSMMHRRYLGAGLKVIFPPYGPRAERFLRLLYRFINY